jgi:hypothetical protein
MREIVCCFVVQAIFITKSTDSERSIIFVPTVDGTDS